MIELDNSQKQAFKEAVGYLRYPRDKPSYRIGGYAGTGKTTIISMVIAEVPDMTYRACAFAGKAAHVMRKKGILGAETIHRTIYEWDDNSETFRKRDALGCDFLLVDEGSMIPEALWDDLLSFRKPIIVSGDPGQLEPIGSDARLMHDPDIILETIHRYEGSIAWFANHVRRHGNYPLLSGEKGEVALHSKGHFQSYMKVWKPDVILCGLNQTRIALNQWLREKFITRLNDRVVVGDKLICLHNDRDLGVFNGLTMVVDAISNRYTDYTVADVTFDDGRKKHDLLLWHGQIGNPHQIGWRDYPRGKCIVDYAYALTVHKFQGSEDAHVAVLDEVPAGGSWDMARWRYTACTRAAENLVVFI
jgi:ATP-dependent exoDNAse (exonuclease V) alpha subunit